MEKLWGANSGAELRLSCTEGRARAQGKGPEAGLARCPRRRALKALRTAGSVKKSSLSSLGLTSPSTWSTYHCTPPCQAHQTCES